MVKPCIHDILNLVSLGEGSDILPFASLTGTAEATNFPSWLYFKSKLC